MKSPSSTVGIASRLDGEGRRKRHVRRSAKGSPGVDVGVGSDQSDHVAKRVGESGSGGIDRGYVPTHVSFLANVAPISKNGPADGGDDNDHGDSDHTVTPPITHVLASSTSKLPINRHPQSITDKLQTGLVNPWEKHYEDTINYLKNANFLVLSEASATQPVMNQIYPRVVTYELWNGDEGGSVASGSHANLIHDPPLGPLRHLGLAKQGGSGFNNVKHINNFFMADETRLPIYIAAFGSGFFSVLICLCAILYTKYLFSKVRRVKGGAKHQKSISTLPLIDKQALIEAHSHENLAELRAMNPSLARIEDYISGEVKKWERRVRLAEENAGSPSGLKDIVNDLVSGEESNDESESDDDELVTIATSQGPATTTTTTNAVAAATATNNVPFDSIFRSHTRFDGSYVEESDSEESESEEDDDSDASEDEYSDSEESEEEYSSEDDDGSSSSASSSEDTDSGESDSDSDN